MNQVFTISDLAVETSEGKKILNGVNLKIGQGEIHAVMGPNGGGKSTLAQALMGHPGYKITRGKILVGNKDITNLAPDERAKLGLFLGFQYPVEVAGVNFASFLRMAVNEKAKEKISPIAFRKELALEADKLAFADDMATRSLNEGFSGGEKKKSEILQMTMLKPMFAVLDEPDSGLDVDALRYISTTVKAMEKPPGLLLITHYQRILSYLKPDFVHILIKGKIVKSGGPALAEEIEKGGYEKYQK
jgi:Fe-S cluster assembly ATP-binding protein